MLKKDGVLFVTDSYGAMFVPSTKDKKGEMVKNKDYIDHIWRHPHLVGYRGSRYKYILKQSKKYEIRFPKSSKIKFVVLIIGNLRKNY